MFTRLIAVFVFTALLSTNFTRFFVYAGFEINKKYISEKLCINRSRPWMHCNGKCYFMKKIKQAQEDEKKQERQDQKSRYQEALPVIQASANITFQEPDVRNIYPRSVIQQPVMRSYAILLPPKVA